MKTDRLRTELGKARQKAAEWKARADDIERRLTERENLEIIKAVRSVTVSPEELGEILDKIRTMKKFPQENDLDKEEPKPYEE